MQIMKNKDLRFIIGTLALVLSSAGVYNIFNISSVGEHLLFIGVFLVLFYTVCKFSEWGTDEVVEFTMKSKEQLQEEQIDNEVKLLEATRLGLIMESVNSSNPLNKEQLDDRLDLLDNQIKYRLSNNYKQNYYIE